MELIVKPYKITEKDLIYITDLARKEYIDNSIHPEYYLAQCYLKACLLFIGSKKLKLVEGKLVSNESQGQ